MKNPSRATPTGIISIRSSGAAAAMKRALQVDARAAGGIDQAKADRQRLQVPCSLRGDDEVLIELGLLGDRGRRKARGGIGDRLLEYLVAPPPERCVRELDVVEAIVRRIRIEAQRHGGTRAAEKVARRSA